METAEGARPLRNSPPVPHNNRRDDVVFSFFFFFQSSPTDRGFVRLFRIPTIPTHAFPSNLGMSAQSFLSDHKTRIRVAANAITEGV